MTWADQAAIIDTHFRDAESEYLGLWSGHVLVTDAMRPQHLASSLRRLKCVKKLTVGLSVELKGAA